VRASVLLLSDGGFKRTKLPSLDFSQGLATALVRAVELQSTGCVMVIDAIRGEIRRRRGFLAIGLSFCGLAFLVLSSFALAQSSSSVDSHGAPGAERQIVIATMTADQDCHQGRSDHIGADTCVIHAGCLAALPVPGSAVTAHLSQMPQPTIAPAAYVGCTPSPEIPPPIACSPV
jgi:drug/metabolite transporter (DMT)-like permease